MRIEAWVSQKSSPEGGEGNEAQLSLIDAPPLIFTLLPCGETSVAAGSLTQAHPVSAVVIITVRTTTIFDPTSYHGPKEENCVGGPGWGRIKKIAFWLLESRNKSGRAKIWAKTSFFHFAGRVTNPLFRSYNFAGRETKTFFFWRGRDRLFFLNNAILLLLPVLS